MQNR
jgi:hypothetical protein